MGKSHDDAEGTQWLDAEIRSQHGYLAFQHPDKIADALRLVTDDPPWEQIAGLTARSVDDLKTTLKLIVDRRNKIAHEADMDPTPPRSKYPITADMVRESLDLLETPANAIAAL